MKIKSLPTQWTPLAAVVAVVFLGSMPSAQAQSNMPANTAPGSSAVTAASSASSRIILPERTEIRVRIEKELKSGGNKAGEDVPFVLENDVYSPSHVLLLTAGTPAYGTITQSSRRGMFGKGGKIRFTCDYIKAPDSTHVPLRSDPMIARGKDNRGATAAVAILLTPLGLLMSGKDVTVKKGQEFIMYVDKDTVLTPFTAATASSK